MKLLLLLLQPFNATRINAAAIDDRVKELQKENKNVTGKAGFYEEFEVRQVKYLLQKSSLNLVY